MWLQDSIKQHLRNLCPDSGVWCLVATYHNFNFLWHKSLNWCGTMCILERPFIPFTIIFIFNNSLLVTNHTYQLLLSWNLRPNFYFSSWVQMNSCTCRKQTYVGNSKMPVFELPRNGENKNQLQLPLVNKHAMYTYIYIYLYIYIYIYISIYISLYIYIYILQNVTQRCEM